MSTMTTKEHMREPSQSLSVQALAEPEIFRKTRSRFNQWLQAQFDNHYHTLRNHGYRCFLARHHPTELERYDEACEALRREEFHRFSELQTLGLFLYQQVQLKEKKLRQRRRWLLTGIALTSLVTGVCLMLHAYEVDLSAVYHWLTALPAKIAHYFMR